MNAALSRMELRKNLFVFGHMRSYSSLLCHILGSHAEIDGYCETHIKYRSYFDLFRLRRRVTQLTGEPLSGRYVLDKVLHDYPLAGGILGSRSSRGIILLRRPGSTVRSIMKMGMEYIDVAWYRDVEAVARYYEGRLEGLVRLAGRMQGRVALLESEALLSDTAAVLDRLVNFLELGAPLESVYRRFSHTGEAGYGDPSEAIVKGRVAEARTSSADVEVPEPILVRLERVYLARSAELRERCSALIP